MVPKNTIVIGVLMMIMFLLVLLLLPPAMASRVLLLEVVAKPDAVDCPHGGNYRHPPPGQEG
ncbi:unnamed protein product [Linum tenue]|uniref:Transmembrane protein n=1 Tax=Linum tenue TaxID=586396 RepID=A0AAV0J5C4_9ROSI|nr:unnamed protein product [Linum tenue]CAI0404807.1 unnamed protein product [Linum tenue]